MNGLIVVERLALIKQSLKRMENGIDLELGHRKVDESYKELYLSKLLELYMDVSQLEDKMRKELNFF